MTSVDHISHIGTVTHHQGDQAIVQLMQQEECHSCRMKYFCGVTDEERARFEIPVENLKVGDRVTLEISPHVGFKALFWAYLFPFLLILIILIGGALLGIAEQWSGLFSLLVLPPYFLTLSRYRKQLKSQLNLKVSRL